MKNITTSQSGRLLPICEENAPQNNKTPRPQCGTDTPTFLSAVYNRGTQARKRQADVPQSGRSMIEMLGVLAIIGVLSVGGITGYSKAMQKYRINKTIDQISQISNGIHTLYTNRSNYAGLDIQLLAKARIIPQELIGYSEETTQGPSQSYDDWLQAHPCPHPDEDTGCYWHGDGDTAYEEWDRLYMNDCQWNATCTSTVTTQTFHGTNPFDGRILLSVDGDAKAFSLNYLGLPEDACIEVLTQDWGTTDLIAVGVDSSITSTYGCTGDKGTHVCNNQLPISVDKAMTLCGQQTGSKGVILKFR